MFETWIDDLVERRWRCQIVVDQVLGVGAFVDDEIDGDVGPPSGSVRGVRGPPEDLGERIESPLRSGASERLPGSVVAELGETGSLILVEFGLDERVEDGDQLRGGDGVATRGSQVDALPRRNRRGVSGLDGAIAVLVGAVLVGEHLPATHTGAQVVELQRLGLLQQQRTDLAEAVAAPRVRASPASSCA